MAVDRKQQIIKAATKSFTLFGYKATTMEQIAKLANVGKGTIYTFFKNKDDLFDEIVSTLITEMKEAGEATIQEDLSFMENAHRLIYTILEFRKEHKLAIKLFQEEKEMGTLAVNEVMRKMENTILTYIEEKVKQAIKHGEIKECNPKITAYIFLKLYISLIFDWEQNHKPLQKEEIASLFELYLFKGLEY